MQDQPSGLLAPDLRPLAATLPGGILAPGHQSGAARRSGMCLDCHCQQPNEDHGDPRHITYERLKAAALASKIDPEVAVARIQAELKRIRDAACDGVPVY